MMRALLLTVLVALLCTSAFAQGYPGAGSYTGPGRCEVSFVADYGADNTGATDCLGAWLNFIASTDEYLFIPAGTYKITLTTGTPYAPCARDVTITGAGESATTINVGPDTPTLPGALLWLTDEATVKLQGLTINGPSAPTIYPPFGSPNIDQSPRTYLVAAIGLSGTDPTSITLDHVAWTAFNYPIYTSGNASPTTITLTNCLGKAWEQNVAFYASDTSYHRLIAKDCGFARWGKGPTATDPIYGHCLYVANQVGLDLDGCAFANEVTANHHAVNWSSGSNTATAPVRSIKDCIFGHDSSVKLDGNGPTTVTGCAFDYADGWSFLGDDGFTFTGCSFKGAVWYGPSSGGALTYDGCTFTSGDWIVETGTTWTVMGGTFAGGILKFFGTTTSDWTGATFPTGHVYVIQGATGAHAFHSCSFSGSTFWHWNGSTYASASTPSCSACTVE